MVLSSIRSHGGHVVSVFSTITVMMMSTMLGLMVCNSWLRSRQGIINAPDSSYDYIIVGGGTAGCVLANRLSDNPNTSVLLVEAGRHFGWLSTVPITAPLLQGSVADWSYLTVPQKHSSWGLWNQSSAWPRGKGLGGSGQLNYLIHFGGSRADFDGWVRSGAEGWGYRDMLPYLGKMFGAPPCGHRTHCTLDYKEMLLGNLLSSQCRLEQQHCNQASKSESGPMHIDTVDLEQSALGRAFVEAGRLLGLRFRLTQSTVFRGQRWGTLEGYLRPVLGKRKNLHVLLATHANKVVFSQEPGKRVRAVGVELRGPEGESWLVHSSRDTILSAGTVNTPQILMLSGVGPASLLRRLGIPVVVDLPVGDNLHDHLNMPLYVTLELPVSVTTDKVLTFSQLRKFFLSGEGLLASSAVMGVGSAHRNISLVLFGMGSPDEKVMRDIANMKPQTFSGLFHFNGSNETSKEGFVMLASCLQPLSRGTVSLANRHPFTPPLIDPRYLQQPQDVACLVEAVQVAARVVSSPPFRRLGARLRLPRLEECEDLIPDPHDSGFLECVVRTVAITGYHPGGTCRMGHPRDATTVLDPQLRVVGVAGLRVMDGSVLPTPVSGHPNSVLVAMAERAAVIIAGTE